MSDPTMIQRMARAPACPGFRQRIQRALDEAKERKPAMGSPDDWASVILAGILDGYDRGAEDMKDAALSWLREKEYEVEAEALDAALAEHKEGGE